LLDLLTRRSSIRGILLVILVVSLLPVMMFSTWQGFARLHRDREVHHAQLRKAAMLTSSSQQQVLASARALLAVLAEAPAVKSGDQARCGPMLQAAARSQPALSNFSVSDAQGRIVCASDTGALGVPTTTDRSLWRQVQSGGFLVTAPVWGTVSARMVLRAMLPVKTLDGAFGGVITASIDLDWLRRLITAQHRDPDRAVALVDGRGRPVASNRPMPGERMALTPTTPTGVSMVHSNDGRHWTYAVAPIDLGTEGGETFFVVYAAAQPPWFGSEWWFIAGYFLQPLLALVLASLAIWVGANRAILNGVSQLGALARQIGNGERPDVHRQGFADAPAEVRDLAADLLRMRGTIADREQRLRGAAAAQAEVALELHHRVRNNLQVIASFLSLQAEGIGPGEARDAMEEAQLRVAAMAMVNGLLYAEAEVTTVAMAQLLDPIAEMLGKHIGTQAKVSVEPGLSPRVVGIDHAVPLVLWIIEASLCLWERANPEIRRSHFTIAMQNEDDALCIAVALSGLLPHPATNQRTLAASLHRRLVVAIAHQQGARARFDDADHGSGRILLCLPGQRVAAMPPAAAETLIAG
jgi:two-component sensor histidine kinase